MMAEYPDPIEWGPKRFDTAYDHRWQREVDSGRVCRDCGMRYNQWDGFPCGAKAQHVSFWIPRA